MTMISISHKQYVWSLTISEYRQLQHCQQSFECSVSNLNVAKARNHQTAVVSFVNKSFRPNSMRRIFKWPEVNWLTSLLSFFRNKWKMCVYRFEFVWGVWYAFCHYWLALARRHPINLALAHSITLPFIAICGVCCTTNANTHVDIGFVQRRTV